MEEIEKSIADNKLEHDPKKSEKTLQKIKELTHNYFSNLQKNYHNYQNKLNETNVMIENNEINNELKLKNKELELLKSEIDQFHELMDLFDKRIRDIEFKLFSEIK